VPPPKVFDQSGARVALGARIGAGGEGAIFEVAGRGDRVAKVYHRPVGAEAAAKLAAMIECKTDRLLHIAAWPERTVHGAAGETSGFIMRRGIGRDVHLLYSPKSRIANFSLSTWPFLLRAASNLARAFAVVHQHGHLIGDVNQGNSLVSEQATVMLIDCDSFQIHWQGRTFPCGVGTELFLAPELQGRRLSGLIRTKDHDAFSLAVLVFHLLFMGRHPFAGRYRGPGEMLIERAIREHRFAYGNAAGARQMEPPPCALPLEALSPGVAAFFEQAFSPAAAASGGRPGPEQWVVALDAMARQLSACRRDSAHQYFRDLASCPWCEVEACAGIAFFYLAVAKAAMGATGFDLGRAWQRIAAVPLPPDLQPPDPAAVQCRPSAESRWAALTRLGALAAASASVAAVLAVGAFTGFPLLLAVGLSILLASFFLQSKWGTAWRGVKLEANSARAAWNGAVAHWQAQAGRAPFEAKLRDLEKKKADLLDLPAARRRGLAQLQANVRDLQLRRFLDRYRIGSGGVKGIGPGRSATLRSFGIETAADVSQTAILAVPGFGPALANQLSDWRRSLERRFVFNPSRGIEPEDVAELDRQLEEGRRQIERDLLAGEAELRRLSAQIAIRARNLRPQLQAAAQRVAQAEANSKALRWR
jgi:DNA-binding helix-hairpin-helix protein with protein kinase domain